MSDNLVENFLARERDGLAGLEDDILPAEPVVNENGDGSFETLKETTDDFDQQASEAQSSSTEVPEKILKWKQQQESRLLEKDANEEKVKEVLREQAKKELEDWYKRHEESITKTKSLNRNAEKECVADEFGEEIIPGTEWDRISKLCDFSKSSKSTNNSRMRSIILQLKQTPLERNKA
ncbi:unnamed protein product [Diamesa tonsa]